MEGVANKRDSSAKDAENKRDSSAKDAENKRDSSAKDVENKRNPSGKDVENKRNSSGKEAPNKRNSSGKDPTPERKREDTKGQTQRETAALPNRPWINCFLISRREEGLGIGGSICPRETVSISGR